MRIDVTVANGSNSDDQEVEHVVELILELWHQLILCRYLLISELIQLFELVNLHYVLIFDSEHDGREYDNRGHEYVQQAEPHP